MSKAPYNFIAALLCVLNTGLLFAEEPIVSFEENEEKIALNLSGKYNIGIFQQQSEAYRTDKPWDIGLGVRYKNFAAQAFIPVSANKDSLDIALNFYLKKMYSETFVKRYTNLYNRNDENHENAGLDIMSGGIMAGWIHNYENHSLRSVFAISEKQTVSSGSFLYGFGTFYTSIYSRNTAITRYSERRHIVYFGPTAGYSYTWMLPRGIFLNAGLNTGANLGININDTEILLVPQLNPKITFGHHNASWSINTVMGCNVSVLLWDRDNFSTLTPATMSITFSKRLNLSQK
jgi:hypothetical protein